MERSYEVWSQGHKTRIIGVMHGDRGRFTVFRHYSKGHGGKTFKEWVASYDAMGVSGLHHWTKTYLVTGGSEQWSHDVTLEQGRNIVERFRKSAEKAGFECHGRVDYK